MRDPDDRLSRLESYQALPLPLRRAVRLHLIHGLPVPEAMRLAGRDRNVKRDWGKPAIQAVLAEYGNPDAFEDWVERLKAAQLPPTPPAVLTKMPESAPPQKAGTTAPPAAQHEPISQPGDQAPNATQQNQALTGGTNQAVSGQTVPAAPARPADPDRCTQCGRILCFCPRPIVLGGAGRSVDASDLFPNALASLTGKRGGPTTADIWRQRDQAASDERCRLLADLEYERRKNHHS